ncbi:probable 2-oxoglutarate dehydrogenase E1 component DHKTD1, mitochondrial [Limulus polyphemus]|uniref:Probable 2-oxoglutarate dehydrogenase E1 component DHKTD1, mitochondrial n=1 Tax=Limulus polyphemus TaxID=6850 RepID=A0ABM1BBQ8_LIMPO|nr:probable 2-oxoglutarate dehydrogenase E1 component DHKTD1, mitochondrial [Limulus polyphemus]
MVLQHRQIIKTISSLHIGQSSSNVFRKQKQPFVPATTKHVSRSYHSKQGVYGYKPFPKEEPFKVSQQAVDNRIKQSNLYRMITAYREHGHKVALTDPLATVQSDPMPELDPSRYGLSSSDDSIIQLDGLVGLEKSKGSVQEVIEFLKKAYCGPISVEFQHMSTEEEKEWFAQKFENMQQMWYLTPDKKRTLGKELLKSQMNYSKCGISDIVIGMPHRGRLNLLTGLLNFPAVAMFQKIRGMPEFPETVSGVGDVLSHSLSTSSPQAVSPVTVGKARGKQQSLKVGDYSPGTEAHPGSSVLPVQVHGDASFSGQGIIMETLALANVPHFHVCGSIHLIVNNQLGFTTPSDRGRSSLHCSDVVKIIAAPVIHVNGDHPEEIVKATQLALAYRQEFCKDIIIDLVCFRRWGHNELDDPTFTNPAMYQVIHSRHSVPDGYAQRLVDEGVWTREDVKQILDEHSSSLNENLKQVDSYKPIAKHLKRQWTGLVQPSSSVTSWDTGVPVDLLKFVGAKSVQVPDDFNLHPTLQKSFVLDRLQKVEEGTNLNWATAEALAIGSLLYQGFNVRISGQDVGRGTFSQRHGMLIDQKTNEMYVPLNHMVTDQQGFYEVCNSILSEEAVLGFEYGMSIESPNNLILWEAQFGDFFNGAQIIFDTFISSGENRLLDRRVETTRINFCHLECFLQNRLLDREVETTSLFFCHLECFLQMSDSNESGITDGDNINWQVVNPTTPAQYFHLLRRQVIRNFRKPLIIASPKILLRHPAAVSSLSEMTPGKTFLPVLGDFSVQPSDVHCIIFCSGKHFYALQKHRESLSKKDIAIIRIESLCPFPTNEISAQLQKYPNAKNFIWSQEEHQNMGAWSFIQPRFRNMLGYDLKYVGRGPLGTPAVGIGRIHQQEAKDIVEKPFEN